jgi:hypothetical protein
VERDATAFAGKATSSDPAVGLAAVASLRGLLDSLERLQVERARQTGWTWQRIATELGVTKQAVHKKYGERRRTQRRLP